MMKASREAKDKTSWTDPEATLRPPAMTQTASASPT